MWGSTKEFLQKYYNDEEKLKKCLMNYGILPKEKHCNKCNQGRMAFEPNMNRFKCNRKIGNKACGYSSGALKGSIFSRSKLTIRQIMHIVTIFLFHKRPRHRLQVTLARVSDGTATEFEKICQNVCKHWSARNVAMLGGLGTIVEIGETEFVPVKPRKGPPKKSKLVFGGIERESKKFFLKHVPDKDPDTLSTIIESKIAPGTALISECWRAYDCLTNPHTQNFVHTAHPDVHSQNIDDLWRDLRANLGIARNNFEGLLAEYEFKRTYPKNVNRVDAFLKAMASAHPYLV